MIPRLKGNSLTVLAGSSVLLGVAAPAVANPDPVQAYDATCLSTGETSQFDPFKFRFEISPSAMVAHVLPLDGSSRPVPTLTDLWASFVPSATEQKRFGVLDRSEAGNAIVTVMAFPQDWTGRPNDFSLRLIARDKSDEDQVFWTENFRCEFPEAESDEHQ